MFGAGKAEYEVHVCREGLWRIEATYADEEEAILLARIHLLAPGIDEVKILKYRSVAGIALETVVFQQKAPEEARKPLALQGSAEGAPHCAVAEDLHALSARMVMSRILRQFLDRFRITPTELLHSWPHARMLDDGPLMAAAIHAVARAQTAEGADYRGRTLELRALVEEALAKLRAFNARRGSLPKFEPRRLYRTSRAIQDAFGAVEHDHVFLVLLTQHLAEANALLPKLDLLLGLAGGDIDPALLGLIEGVIADTLGSPRVIKDLLGVQPHLGASLCMLADFLNSRLVLPASPRSRLGRLGRLMDAGLGPSCRIVLTERIRRAIDGPQPLDRRDPEVEGRLLDELVSHLRGLDGDFLGGDAMEKAVARRALRCRQDFLRRQGMHDVADRLPANYTPSVEK